MATRPRNTMGLIPRGKQVWCVSIRVHGVDRYIGKIETTIDQLKSITPYHTIHGNHFVILGVK